MTIDYGSGPKEARATLLSLVVYEQEFGSDLIKDLFGKAEVRRSDLEPQGEGEGPAEGSPDDVVLSFDYGSVNWTASVKALWAFLKAADGTVPPFREWAAGTGDLDMFSVAPQVIAEARRGFFRTGAAASD